MQNCLSSSGINLLSRVGWLVGFLPIITRCLLWKSLEYQTPEHHRCWFKGECRRSSQRTEFLFKLSVLYLNPAEWGVSYHLLTKPFSKCICTEARQSRQQQGRGMKLSLWEHVVLFRKCFTTMTCRARVCLCSTLPLTHPARKAQGFHKNRRSAGMEVGIYSIQMRINQRKFTFVWLITHTPLERAALHGCRWFLGVFIRKFTADGMGMLGGEEWQKLVQTHILQSVRGQKKNYPWIKLLLAWFISTTWCLTSKCW